MKKVAIIFAIVLGIQISTKAQSNFGEKISEKGAISTTDLAKKMDGKEQVKAKPKAVSYDEFIKAMYGELKH